MKRCYSTLSGRQVARRTRRPKAQGKKAKVVLAAQYVGMSTEQQKYSTHNQSDTNHAYAKLRDMEIVRTYADDGKSGLTIDRRMALHQLIADGYSGCADFGGILVCES